MKNRRVPGAERISGRVKEIGREAGLVIAQCEWDIGDDFGHTHAHRLDVITESATVRLYFTDLELMTSNNEARRAKTEAALQSAIAQLTSASRAPTYNFGRRPKMPIIEQSDKSEFLAIIRNADLPETDFKLDELNDADPKSDETTPLQGYARVVRLSTHVEKDYPLEDDVAWLEQFKKDLAHGVFA